jgi:hypothetical protein
MNRQYYHRIFIKVNAICARCNAGSDLQNLNFLTSPFFWLIRGIGNLLVRLENKLSVKTDESSDSHAQKTPWTEFSQIEAVDEVMCEILRQKSSLERLKIAFGLWRSARKQLFNYIRSLHPDWDEKRISKEVAKRISHGAT